MMPVDPPRIDAHTHLFYGRDFLGPMLHELDLRVVVVNITGKGFFKEPVDARWHAMLALKEAHPDSVVLCTTFDPEEVVHGPGADAVIAQLARHLDQGAAVVKVWKDLGLGVRDATGRYLQVDDDAFTPIWQFLADEDIPVIAHIAEPRAAWQPLDERSPHFQFYRDHPGHHLLGRTDLPSWESLIEARDRWIAKNPSLRIIGAHLGSTEHDVAEVAARLDRYPNFFVDTAERFCDLFIQPSDKVREFFVRYADRILYGTDVIQDAPPGAPLDEAEFRRRYEELLASHHAYLAGEDVVEVQDKFIDPIRVRALGLPPDVLRRIYVENAERLLL